MHRSDAKKIIEPLTRIWKFLVFDAEQDNSTFTLEESFDFDRRIVQQIL